MWHALRHESGNNLPVLHTRNCDCGNGCERTPEMHPLSAEHLPRRIQDSTQLAGCAWGETANSGVDESITKAHLVIRRHRISSKGGKFPRKRCDDHRASAQARFDHARAMTAGSSAAVQAKPTQEEGRPASIAPEEAAAILEARRDSARPPLSSTSDDVFLVLGCCSHLNN